MTRTARRRRVTEVRFTTLHLPRRMTKRTKDKRFSRLAQRTEGR